MKPKVKWMTNMDSLGDLLGGMSGIADGLSTDDYLGGVIRQAHSEAANIFDLAVSATANTGRLQHVFEYGTDGITRGRRAFSNTDPAARLWVHEIVGQGRQQDFGFAFRPATQRNPTPTTATTGVASKYLKKLSKRKYIFRQKAMVMESGMEVEIHPKSGKYLFVPFYGEPGRNPKNTKGFAMVSGPLQMTPGEKTQGTFTAFWANWWGAQGQSTMEEQMEKTVTLDVNRAVGQVMKRAQSEGRKLKRVESDNIRFASSRARKWSELVIKEYGRTHRNVGYTG